MAHRLLSIFTTLLAVAYSSLCPQKLNAVYADMHDGDKKEVLISGTKMTIKPSGNNQSWVVNAEVDSETCSAIVDFNVPGKPSPPPVNLTATLFRAASHLEEGKTELLFTDPTGTLPAGPLNQWVELGKSSSYWPPPCPTKLKVVYADMHDGDKKEVTISGASMTITPFGNNQTWVVKTELDSKSCTAVIDFNVPGKPSPPPVKLAATWWTTGSVPSQHEQRKNEFEFTDPSGTLAAIDFPLNHWVEIGNEKDDSTIAV